MQATFGQVQLDGVQMPTWLLKFDKDGKCTSSDARKELLDHLRESKYSDVIFFAHGWNNDFKTARGMYTTFMNEFEKLTAARHLPRPKGYAPIFVGVLWPSIWFPSDSDPQIEAALDGAGEAEAESPEQALVKGVKDRHGEQAAKRLRELLKLQQLDDEQARELAELAAPVFGTLDDDETWVSRDTSPDDLLEMLREVQKESEPKAKGLLRFIIDPRHVLRLFSVRQMKDRAGVVGAYGVAALLGEMFDAASEARVHAVGHSFGCKVMLSAVVCAPSELERKLDSLLLLQPAISHLCFADVIPRSGKLWNLLNPLNLWKLWRLWRRFRPGKRFRPGESGKSGGYHEALQRVRAPILCTYSNKDLPLHKVFHLALFRKSDWGERDIGIQTYTKAIASKTPPKFAALGGYGPRHANEKLIPMPSEKVPYPDPPFNDTKVIGLDGSKDVILGHGKIATADTAWALHQLMAR